MTIPSVPSIPTIGLRGAGVAGAGGGSTSYADVVLADSPSLYWRLGETVGTGTVQDETANNRDGTVGAGVTLGATGLIAGDADTCASFDPGASNEVITSSYNPFTNGTGRTYEFWLYRDVQNIQTNIFGSSDGVGGPALVIDQVNRRPTFFAAVNGASVFWATDDIPVTTTCHVVLTFNEATDTAELFVNGVSKGTKTQSVAYSATPGNFQIGTWGTSALSWDGRIDEVAIYESVLSGATILAHYEAGS